MPKLIQLSQIAGGAQLKAALDNIVAGYDLSKVMTAVAKPNTDPVEYYNLQEYLETKVIGAALATNTNTIKSVNDTLTSLREKTLWDRVRFDTNLTLGGDPAKYGLDLDYTLASDTFTYDSTEYKLQSPTVQVYTADGEYLFTTSGDKLTYNLSTKTFNGTPATFNFDSSVKTSDNSKVYTAIEAASTAVKIFPTLQFSLENLPANFLLDNADMELIAHTDAINSVVQELSKDDKLITQIKALIGNTAVADQISTAVNNLSSSLTTTLEGLTAESRVIDEFEITGDANVTSFTLSETPNDQEPIVVINGISYFLGEAFTLNGKVVTWTFTGADGYNINSENTDVVRIIYYVDKLLVTPAEPETPEEPSKP